MRRLFHALPLGSTEAECGGQPKMVKPTIATVVMVAVLLLANQAAPALMTEPPASTVRAIRSVAMCDSLPGWAQRREAATEY